MIALVPPIGTKKPYFGGLGPWTVCGDAVLRYFWCGFAVITTFKSRFSMKKEKECDNTL